MYTSTAALVKAIHQTPHKGVIAITGGGSEAIGELLRYGGGSNTILEAIVPYATRSFQDFIKGTPDQFASDQAARQLAMAAYQRAMKVNDPDKPAPLFGVGMACSLFKEGEREGRQHKIFAAVQTARQTMTFSMVFSAKVGDVTHSREEEERMASWLAIAATAKACDIENPWENFAKGSIQDTCVTGQDWMIDLVHGKRQSWAVPLRHTLTNELLELHAEIDARNGKSLDEGWADLTKLMDAKGTPVNESLRISYTEGFARAANGCGKPITHVFPGSFNPIHDGHFAMIDAVGEPVALEISIGNVDKPVLDYIEIGKRLAALEADCVDHPNVRSVIFTRASKFSEKAAVFPNTTFLVGWDTLTRIFDEKYSDNRAAFRDGLDYLFSTKGCNLAVFPRGEKAALSIPGHVEAVKYQNNIKIHDNFTPLNISSTEIRKHEKTAQAPNPN